jgi:hypothetical protein
MKTTYLTNWISKSVLKSNGELYSLTFRADKTVTNASALKQSVWSHGQTQSVQLVYKALDWTITEMSRKFKEMKFVAFEGGDATYGTYGHFHGLLLIGEDRDAVAVYEKMNYLWSRNLNKTLKTQVQGQITYFQKTDKVVEYASYCQRFEGQTLLSGSEKVLVSRSLRL